MASTSVALRLARRTIWDELRPILVGLGDNIFQTPKPRRRRSAAPHPPPYLIIDGGVPGIIFRKPLLLPVLAISPEHIRFVIGPDAVIDRVHGWDYVCFDRRVGANPFDWRIIVFLLAAAGVTAFFFYRTRPRGDDGPGGPGPDAPGPRGPGPGGRSRFPRSLGLLDVLGVSGGGGGDAGGGRFRRSLGLLEVLGGGGGGGGGGVEGSSGGGGVTRPQDCESSAELQDSTVDVVASHEFPQEAEAYSSERCDWIELFLLTGCNPQVQGDWETSMRLMHNLDIPEGDSSEVAGGVEVCSSGGGGTGPQDPESSAKLQDSTVDGVLARYSHEFPQEAEAYSSQRCDWIELFLLTECISQFNWENSVRLMQSLDFPEGDNSEVAGGVKGCSSGGGGGTGPQDPESSFELQDSISDDNLVSRYSCLTSTSVKSLLQHDGPEEAEVYSSQSCDWIELLAECISQGNWEKTCMRLVHHLGSPEGDSSEVLSACDSSAKERAGDHLSPPSVRVCRG
ncbi:uncharacterized protein [Triticum aestivum]|uniref:uncharacterized protein isoform X2 n=1 Tax=Triticum aestivum TaxID=4565 RepID=UPI001D01CBE1|nr:uncharacterized protein LOC123117462 isoform X2 [Triticum aestivum]